MLYDRTRLDSHPTEAVRIEMELAMYLLVALVIVAVYGKGKEGELVVMTSNRYRRTLRTMVRMRPW